MSDDVLAKVVQDMLETLKQFEERPVKNWGLLTNIGLAWIVASSAMWVLAMPQIASGSLGDPWLVLGILSRLLGIGLLLWSIGAVVYVRKVRRINERYQEARDRLYHELGRRGIPIAKEQTRI